MKTGDFDFELPERLIARYPAAERTASRMMRLDQAGCVTHLAFREVVSLVQPGDLWVFNNTRVIPARVHGRKQSGGKLEILVERILENHTLLVQLKASRSPRPGDSILLGEQEAAFTVEGRQEQFFILGFPETLDIDQFLHTEGHMPLPPYITRSDERLDEERYQTVYATEPGAVAAPTAGLHFDDAILQSIRQAGADIAYLTLHVGAGTFQPVKTENVGEHRMHSERFFIPEATQIKLQESSRRGGRIVAVGTTTLRCLESAVDDDGGYSPNGETEIFITPGYRFKAVDALLTNFHLPRSTLLMLVSAFSGREAILSAYRQAVEAEYRFFSYGDCMFLERSDA